MYWDLDNFMLFNCSTMHGFVSASTMIKGFK